MRCGLWCVWRSCAVSVQVEGCFLAVLLRTRGVFCGFRRGLSRRAYKVTGSSTLVGEVEDEAYADGLEEVGSGLVGDAGDGADAELGDANVHEGEDLEVEAGEALVGDAMVDDDRGRPGSGRELLKVVPGVTTAISASEAY